jgi:hypothetical protein
MQTYQALDEAHKFEYGEYELNHKNEITRAR